MTTEISERKSPTALESMAMRLQVSSQVLQTTLKATAFKECKTNEEFIAAVIVANTYKLNPLLKEIYAFPGKSGGVIPVVPIDGWISLVNRHRDDDGKLDHDGVDLVENEEPTGKPNKSGTTVRSVTASFWIKGKTKPVIVTERMDECFDASKTPWVKWPVRMLRHKAYIQGARVAYGFGGIYDEDEATRIIEAHAIEGSKEEIRMPTPLPPSGTKDVAESSLDKASEAENSSRMTAKIAVASPVQIKTLNTMAEKAGLKDMDYVDFLAERCADSAEITVPELNKCLADLAAIMDGKKKK